MKRRGTIGSRVVAGQQEKAVPSYYSAPSSSLLLASIDSGEGSEDESAPIKRILGVNDGDLVVFSSLLPPCRRPLSDQSGPKNVFVLLFRSRTLLEPKIVVCTATDDYPMGFVVVVSAAAVLLPQVCRDPVSLLQIGDGFLSMSDLRSGEPPLLLSLIDDDTTAAERDECRRSMLYFSMDVGGRCYSVRRCCCRWVSLINVNAGGDVVDGFFITDGVLASTDIYP
ncbi:hypothetical protein ACLOJK_005987 [Asimina triloba]